MRVAVPISLASERAGNQVVREQICPHIFPILRILYTIFEISLVQRHGFLHGACSEYSVEHELMAFRDFFLVSDRALRVCRREAAGQRSRHGGARGKGNKRERHGSATITWRCFLPEPPPSGAN
jgi:hypothetical protein